VRARRATNLASGKTKRALHVLAAINATESHVGFHRVSFSCVIYRSSSNAKSDEQKDHAARSKALFAGITGTGKTMAAEVLSDELWLDPYHFDLRNLCQRFYGRSDESLSLLQNP